MAYHCVQFSHCWHFFIIWFVAVEGADVGEGEVLEGKETVDHFLVAEGQRSDIFQVFIALCWKVDWFKILH